MARRGLDHETVVDGAVMLVNERGAEALSLAELAARYHVRTPSLYNHVGGIDALRRDMTLRALQGIHRALAMAATGRSGGDALRAMASAYRQYALANPGLYPFLVRTTEDADEEVRRVSGELMYVVLAVLRGYALPQESEIDAARVVRSALHGFVSLELGNGFGLPQEVEASFARLVDLLDEGLRGWTAKPGSAGKQRAG